MLTLPPTATSLFLTLLVISAHAERPEPNPLIQGPDNKDPLTNSIMHTLPLEAVVADHRMQFYSLRSARRSTRDGPTGTAAVHWDRAAWWNPGRSRAVCRSW